MEMDKLANEQKAYYLKRLQDLGLDMSKYMVCLQDQFVPEKQVVVGPATKEITLDTNSL